MIGKSFGHYEVLEKLGSGGMGEVYRAKDLNLGRDVAIKVLPEKLVSDPEPLRRFEQEARAASALNHPNIITIYEIGEYEGAPFIAMEHVEGETLRDILAKAPLPTKKLLQIATQIAEGLAKAHAAGIVHRDLKPENLMVTDDGLVKILDFGLAKLTGPPVEIQSETETKTKVGTQIGTILGTVQYMSPEQASGRSVDHRSDQFSLGLILYEMATGKATFKRDTAAATLAAIIEGKAEPMTGFDPSLPGSFRRTVERCLVKEPEGRYASTGELARELEQARDGLGGLLTGVWLRRTAMIAMVGFLAALFGVVGLNLGEIRDRLLGGPGGIQSIAVLPLRNVSGDPEQEYFSDGMTEALITDLGKIGALRVISRTSVMRFKGADTPLAEIARQLNVEAVVEGSAQLVGEQAGITVRLIDAAAEKQLWSQTYQRDLSNLLVFQSELAQAIAREIEVAVTPEESRLLASARPVNPEAHEAHLKGVFHWQKLTPPDLEAALAYFELALEKDPNYAPAYVGIARVWSGRNQMGYVPPSEAVPKMKAAVLKALELDESLAEAQNGLAILKTWGEWDWPSAERAFERAIELNPNYAEARAYYSHFLNIMGHPEEALAQIERALELDPFNALYQALYGADLLFVRRYDDAIAQLRKARRLTPGSPMVHTGLHSAFYLKGMYEEAFEEKRAWFAAAGDREVEAALARGYADAGYPGAMTLAADMLAARSNYNKPMDIAALYVSAGKKDQSLDWLEKAFEAHDPNIPYLSVIPHFDGLRDDPRYEELLRRMNVPQTRLQRK